MPKPSKGSSTRKPSKKKTTGIDRLLKTISKFNSAQSKAERYVTREVKTVKRSAAAAKSVARSGKSVAKSIQKIVQKKRSISKLKQKRNYSVRDLPIDQKGTMAQLLQKIDRNVDEIDKLKKPGEWWAAEIEYNHKTHAMARTLVPYGSIDLLVRALGKYEEIQQLGNKRNAVDGLIKKIRIIKFAGSAVQYQKIKKIEVEEREARKKEAAAIERKKGQKQRGELRAAKREAREQKKAADKAKREAAKLREQLKRERERSKKKTTKRGKRK